MTACLVCTIWILKIERTLVNAYTDYDEAVSDLMARVKPEYQNLATLTNEDLMSLTDDEQQTL